MLLSRGCHKWVVFGGSVNRITFRFAAARMLSGQYVCCVHPLEAVVDGLKVHIARIDCGTTRVERYA